MPPFDAEDMLRNLARRLIEHRDCKIRSDIDGLEILLECVTCDENLLTLVGSPRWFRRLRGWWS